MKYLFLDLEITGFDTSCDQILELAGAVCILNNHRLDIETTFTTLIKPTIAIPEHIPRLTGLTEVDFVNAPDLDRAQKLWQVWIDEHDLFDTEIIIVGHSVATDIKFLKANHFWLPNRKNSTLSKSPNSPQTPFCDTLNLAKILLPDQTNLSLEYLVKNLSLDKQVLEYISKFNTKLNLSDIKPHRALFDTLTGVEFLNFCLNRITSLNLPQPILDILLQFDILPCPLKSLAKVPNHFQLPLPSHFSDSDDLKALAVDLDFLGQALRPSITDKIEQLATLPAKIISNINDPKLISRFKIALNQIYIFLATKEFLPSSQLRIHTYGLEEKVAIELMIDFLWSMDDTSIYLERTSVCDKVIPVFERILNNIQEVVEVEFEFAKFSYLVDFLANCYTWEFDRAFTPKVSVEMDFWSARIESVLQSNPKKELQINRIGQNSDLDLNDVFNNFQNICEKFQELEKQINQIPKTSHLINFLADKTLEYLLIFKRQNWSNSSFIVRLSKNILKLTKIKNDFDWNNYWYKLSQISNLTLTTYLDQNSWQMLGDLVDMPDDLYTIPNDFVKCLRTNNVEVLQTEQVTENLLVEVNKKVKTGSITLVLCGQNSGLEKVIELCVNNFQAGEFLAIGESGSLAKISGKIRMGFSGMVIIKSTDLFILKQIPDLKLGDEAFLIQPPYLNLNQFWFQKGSNPKDMINTTKRILRNSIIGQLSQLGVKTVMYQAEIVK